MADIVAAAFVFIILIGGLIVALRVINKPEELKAKVEATKAQELHKASANHQELFLVVSQLISDEERGLSTPFLNQRELDRAKAAVETYREEITP